MFDKIKSAIFKATRNTLSRKDPEIVKWNNEMAIYSCLPLPWHQCRRLSIAWCLRNNDTTPYSIRLWLFHTKFPNYLKTTFLNVVFVIF
jgi:hypothetical protein